MTVSYRSVALLVVLLLLCTFATIGQAEIGVSSMIGNWAYSYAPGISVLTVAKDGTAVWEGERYTWEDDGKYLLLRKDTDGEIILLRYDVAESKMLIYPPRKYTRIAETAGEGITGTWKEDAENSSSSFVFTTAGKFLEDSNFPGDYIVEDDTFTLQYQANFEDTRCWFVQDGDTMTVEYPWPVIPVE